MPAARTLNHPFRSMRDLARASGYHAELNDNGSVFALSIWKSDAYTSDSVFNIDFAHRDNRLFVSGGLAVAKAAGILGILEGVIADNEFASVHDNMV